MAATSASSSSITTRSAPPPTPTPLCSAFLETTYAAAADLGHWDRAALECALWRAGRAADGLASPKNGNGEIVFLVSLTVSVIPAGGAARWGQRTRGQIAQAGPIGVTSGFARSRPSA